MYTVKMVKYICSASDPVVFNNVLSCLYEYMCSLTILVLVNIANHSIVIIIPCFCVAY